MSLDYHRDHIDQSVNKLHQIVHNDTRLSRAARNDLNLLLYHLTSHEQSRRGQICSPILVNGWANEYFLDCSILSNYRTLETMFLHTIRHTHTELQWLHCTDCTDWLERMPCLGPSTGCTSSHMAVCYAPEWVRLLCTRTRLSSTEPQVGPIKVLIWPLQVGPYQDHTLRRWTFLFTSPSGHRYADDGSATTLNYFV